MEHEKEYKQIWQFIAWHVDTVLNHNDFYMFLISLYFLNTDVKIETLKNDLHTLEQKYSHIEGQINSLGISDLVWKAFSKYKYRSNIVQYHGAVKVGCHNKQCNFV